MTRIEIYGPPDDAETDAAEEFCRRMSYPHVRRDISDPMFRREAFARDPAAGIWPRIIIGSLLLGSTRDLIETAPFVVQQMIGE